MFDLEPWLNICTTHRLDILDICAELFENPTKGAKDIEWTRECDRQTDGQGTGRDRQDRQTDRGAKNNVSLFLSIHV